MCQNEQEQRLKAHAQSLHATWHNNKERLSTDKPNLLIIN